MLANVAQDSGQIVNPKHPENRAFTLSPAEIHQAADIVTAEWGEKYGKLFIEESMLSATIEGSATYGIVSDAGKVIATGTIVKSMIDYALWGITWVVVDPAIRKQGLGTEITRALIDHARANGSRFPSQSVVIELTTTTPEYYTRFGFKPVTRWGEGRSSHLMILDTKDYAG